MPIMYKLVSRDMTSKGGMKWEIGKKNVAIGEGEKLCTHGVLHCYATPEQAAMFSPIHVAFINPILLKIETSAVVSSDGLKYGTKEQTPLAEESLPKLTTTQRIAFAIKIALSVYTEASFKAWAENWLSGINRTDADAYAAAYAADAAADAAYAADAAAYAARAACAAAYAAADAARGGAYAAAYAGERAARVDALLRAYAGERAARAAADAAAYAGERAARAGDETKFQEIIQWVLESVK